MTTETALTTTNQDPRNLALLKAVGLDRLAPEQRELALAIAKRYDLDLLLKHLVMIEGRPYITRDALLWIAHRSGQFDGIETTVPEIVNDEWRCTAKVWRKDMSHPFVYGGRYTTKGGNQKFAPEMAIKVAESMALRRAFNVAAPVAEERWDLEVPEATTPPPPPLTLAERAAERRAAVAPPEPEEPPTEALSEPQDAPDVVPPHADTMTLLEFKRRRRAAAIPDTVVMAALGELFPMRMADQLTPAEVYRLADRVGVA